MSAKDKVESVLMKNIYMTSEEIRDYVYKRFNVWYSVEYISRTLRLLAEVGRAAGKWFGSKKKNLIDKELGRHKKWRLPCG